MTDWKKQGKKNRKKGAEFEKKVRTSLEKEGWIVSKWSNNVELFDIKDKLGNKLGRMIPAKSNRFLMRTCGFPDFICIKVNRLYVKFLEDYTQEQMKEFMIKFEQARKQNDSIFTGATVSITPEVEVMFVECKLNGYVTKEEKEKVRWIKEHTNIKTLIAYNVGGVVNYKELNL